MNIIIGCEASGVVRRAFRALGHEAWSCDFRSSEDDSPYHIQDDVLDHLDDGWDMGIFHPDCTYLTNAGVRWLHERKERWQLLEQASRFFNLLLAAPIPLICVENPIQHKYARERITAEYAQLIQPWQFGHKEMKATCLWLKGLPPLSHSRVVGPPPKNPEERKKWAKVHRASPGPDRWIERSRTYTGIARAMAKQWGTTA